MAIQTQAKIPVLDFSSEDLKHGTGSWFSMRKQVCHALKEYGCFVVELGHKVSLQLHNKIFDAVGELFDFPTETKKKITYEKSLHGYASSALHERLVIEEEGEIADSYVKQMEELDKMVMRLVFENYGAEKYYNSHMESTTHTVAFLKYNEPQKTGTNTGLKNHTDKHFTFILHQNRIKGLEIKTKNGEWIGFDPSPSTFIFLAADALQVWSNDRIEACVQRVTLSTENEMRYSLELFAFNDGSICVPEELNFDEDHPLQYRPLNILEYFKDQKAQASHGELSVKAYCGV
ncbi:probable 2-oxoglutarate-dependent dioxygenase AOP1 [Quercus robur]|uniref:probable 2-oxoglutarate-dependent dioxygenase AOP1 n=1 Tax=Quercus robur TaxID=38942 RepID=UPI0021616EE1|nr:probable 2-oxoglutarate-dependent dioxygenase AOP1 [Quercus robur]